MLTGTPGVKLKFEDATPVSATMFDASLKFTPKALLFAPLFLITWILPAVAHEPMLTSGRKTPSV